MRKINKNNNSNNTHSGLVVLLFVIMWLSSVGGYYSTEYSRYAMLYGTVGFLVLSFFMMIVPFTYRINSTGKIERTKGKRICSMNSWIAFIISVLITVFTKVQFGVGGLGALFFYYINMSLFVRDDELNEKDNNIDNSLNMNKEVVSNDEDINNEERQRYEYM